MIRSSWQTWPSRSIADSKDALIELRNCVDNLDTDDDTIERYLSRMLVVRSCGHLEFTLEQGILDSIGSSVPPHIENHIKSGLFKGRNPNPTRIQELLGSFHASWKQEISDFLDLDDELLKRELSFLVDKRNSIAHGQSEGIGRRKSLDLCKYALQVADRILEIIQPETFKSM